MYAGLPAYVPVVYLAELFAKVQQCRQTDAGSNPAWDLRVPSF